MSKNTEKALLRRRSTDFVLSCFDITVNCRDVIGRKHHNNSESCFSFCHCFLKFLLNGYFHCPQDNSTASGPPAREGCHRESDHVTLSRSFPESKISCGRRQDWSRWYLVVTSVHVGQQAALGLADRRPMKSPEGEGCFLLAQFLSPPCFFWLSKKKIVSSCLLFSLVSSLNWGPDLNKLSL